ncbi:hypothetical protein ACTFIY_011234 [Dictyostelium cf. discoideum]
MSEIFDGLSFDEIRKVSREFKIKAKDNIKSNHINLIKQLKSNLKTIPCICYLCQEEKTTTTTKTTNNDHDNNNIEKPNKKSSYQEIIKFSLLNLIKIQDYLQEKFKYPLQEKKQVNKEMLKYYFNYNDIQEYISSHSDLLYIKSLSDIFAQIGAIIKNNPNEFSNGFVYFSSFYTALKEIPPPPQPSIENQKLNNKQLTIKTSKDEKDKGKKEKEEEKEEDGGGGGGGDYKNNEEGVKEDCGEEEEEEEEGEDEEEEEEEEEEDEEKKEDQVELEKGNKKRKISSRYYYDDDDDDGNDYDNDYDNQDGNNQDGCDDGFSEIEKFRTIIKSNINDFESNIMNNFNFYPVVNRLKLNLLQLSPAKEYVRFFILKILEDTPTKYFDQYSGKIRWIFRTSLYPPPFLENFWNTHVLDSLNYTKFHQVLGVEIHTDPFNFYDDIETKEERYQRTLQIYQKYFEKMDSYSDIWIPSLVLEPKKEK